MAGQFDEQSLGELFATLSRDTGVLIRKEFELANAEMTLRIRNAATHVAFASAGGALVHAGILVLLAAIVIALTQLGVSAWLSALLVALGTIGAGYAMTRRAVFELRRTSLVPTKTIETLKENATWTNRTPA
jgi:hypothetical protein